MGGRLLLDTNIVVAMIRGDTPVVTSLKAAEQIFVPTIVLGELYFGAFNSSRRDENIARIDELAQATAVLDCNRMTARIYGQIKNDLRRKGRPIPENDLWIAALAIQYDLTLASLEEHFRQVNDLDLADFAPES